MRNLDRGTAIVVVLAAFLLGACSRSHSPAAPTGSSPASPPSSVTAGNATITGTLSAAAAAASLRPRGAAAGLTVSIVGTSLSAIVDAGGAFALSGVPSRDVELKFDGPGVSAAITIGGVQPLEQIHVIVTVNGSTAIVESQQRTGTNNTVEGDGKIDDLDATPRRFLMSGTVVDASTATIRRADGTPMTFDDLRRGDRVHVRGAREGGAIRATEVIDQNSAAPPVTFSGTIAAVAGSCPSVTITLNGVSSLSFEPRNAGVNVSTRTTTTFTAKSCGELRSGDLATIVALRQADDSLVATSVEAKNPPPVTFSGTVAGISGGCPAVTITVSGVSGLSIGSSNYTVTVVGNTTTIWPTKTCDQIRTGDSAGITAARQPDGSYLASRVDAKAPPVVAVTFAGTIGSVSGSCPVVTLAMNGVSGLSIGPQTYAATVVTNPSTLWPTNACGSARSGDAATIVATKQGDGTYLASKVDAKTPAPSSVTFNGTIASVAGSCPALTLSMSGVSGLSAGILTYSATVATNATTTFATNTCANVKPSDTATIVAVRQGDGTYLASKVDARPPATYTVSGTVTSVSGSCPALKLVVGGVTVSTNPATRWLNEGCAAVKIGDSATVVKVVQADGSYLAISVDAKPPAPVTFSGSIATISGSCPSLTVGMTGVSGLTVGTRTYTATVVTNAATSFATLACAAIATGKGATVTGTKQADGSYVAAKLDAK